jgi:hypothetical protein
MTTTATVVLLSRQEATKRPPPIATTSIPTLRLNVNYDGRLCEGCCSGSGRIPRRRAAVLRKSERAQYTGSVNA